MATAFSPTAIAEAVRNVLNVDDPTLPLGKSHAFVTNYDGHSVRAAYAQRINDVWSVQATAEWHGGRPDAGVQVHATW